MNMFMMAQIVISILLIFSMCLAFFNLRSNSINTRCVYDFIDQLFRVGCHCFGLLCLWSSNVPDAVLLGASWMQFWFGLSIINASLSTLVRHIQLREMMRYRNDY